MQVAFDAFTRNVARARSITGLHVALSAQAAPVLDLSDILRAALVLGVSALDHLVHELTRVGMLEVFDKKRPPTPSFGAFKVPLETVGVAIGAPGAAAWLDDLVRSSHGWQSFQKPDKIAEALRLVSTVKLWDEVGKRLGLSADDVKTRLALIVDRRNKIAHEADLDPTDPSHQTRWPITAAEVNDALDFVAKVGEAIFLVVKI